MIDIFGSISDKKSDVSLSIAGTALTDSLVSGAATSGCCNKKELISMLQDRPNFSKLEPEVLSSGKSRPGTV